MVNQNPCMEVSLDENSFEEFKRRTYGLKRINEIPPEKIKVGMKFIRFSASVWNTCYYQLDTLEVSFVSDKYIVLQLADSKEPFDIYHTRNWKYMPTILGFLVPESVK